MKYSRQWKTVSKVSNGKRSVRLKIYGGWIVVVDNDFGDDESSFFVPDKNHEWELEDQ